LFFDLSSNLVLGYKTKVKTEQKTYKHKELKTTTEHRTKAPLLSFRNYSAVNSSQLQSIQVQSMASLTTRGTRHTKEGVADFSATPVRFYAFS
jgi:hypothetical protein